MDLSSFCNRQHQPGKHESLFFLALDAASEAPQAGTQGQPDRLSAIRGANPHHLAAQQGDSLVIKTAPLAWFDDSQDGQKLEK